MKKTIAALLAVMMLTTAFAGCSKKKTEPEVVPETAPIEETAPVKESAPVDGATTDGTQTPADGEAVPAE